LGIRYAVPEAVSWAIQETGQVIVVEDDVRLGQDFFHFMEYALETFKDDPRVGHVSGYNTVPQKNISFPGEICRASVYPESYAWGTWADKWQHYSDEIPKLPFEKLQKLTGTVWSAIEWRINFYDARVDRVSTWAYRWVASLWNNNLIGVTPNRNIATYVGQKRGTHTRTQPRWKEIETLEIVHLEKKSSVEIDRKAEQWISRAVFKGYPWGILIRMLESLGLATINALAKFERKTR
jgi:hypothetical protein